MQNCFITQEDRNTLRETKHLAEKVMAILDDHSEKYLGTGNISKGEIHGLLKAVSDKCFDLSEYIDDIETGFRDWV